MYLTRNSLVFFLALPALNFVSSVDPFPRRSGPAAPATACDSLSQSLGPQIVQASGVEYEAIATGAWNIFNAQSRPACIVFPQDAGDVQSAMRTIVEFDVQYAVQAGSHSAMKGWNTVQDGVLIVFSNMTNIAYNAEEDSIILQPGVHWDDAIAALQQFGVAPVGGRQGDVGLGLLLGGGLSFLSPAYGFGCDSFKELDVVLVSGELVTANATNEYADLFRALKGGGSRFGIVTRYELYPVHTGTAEDKNWFGGTIIFANQSAEALLNATANYVRDVEDPNAVLLVSIVSLVTASGPTLFPVVNLFYQGPSLPSSIFGEFLALPNVTTSLGPLSYSDVTKTLDSGNERGNGWHYGASAFVGEASLYQDAYKHWSNFSQTFKDDLNISVLAFTPVLGPQIEAGRARGGNAISPPDGGYAAVQLAQSFNPGVLDIPADVAQGIALLFEQVPRSPGKPFFMNECDVNQNVYETYGDYEFLKTTYAKYDPTRFNVNHMEGPIGL